MITDRIDKYLKRFASNIECGTRSRYYTLPTGIVRVSDHVGKNSTAVISIIITNKNDYILHKHSSGELSNISYNDLKKLVKSLGEYGSLFSNFHYIRPCFGDTKQLYFVLLYYINFFNIS